MTIAALMLPPEDPIVTNRRKRLRQWIDTHFGGSMKLFIASTNDGNRQLNQGELSALLRNKSFGERRARSLEAMAHMPPRYLDTPIDGSATTPQHPFISEKIAPNPFGSTPANPTVTPVGWPFSKVSLARIVALRKQLGPRAGANAMQDIDETLELVVSKWERRAATSGKSVA